MKAHIHTAVSQSLKESWSAYYKRFKATRKKLSEKNVHDLRVATRRFEALLVLLKALIEDKQIIKLITSLKKIRHSLSSLRDLQVEEKLIKGKTTKRFLKFIHKQETKKEKKALKELLQISLLEQKALMQEIYKNLTLKKINTLHSLRIITKKLRYQAEILGKILSKKTIDLQELKKLQTVIGNIQNNRVLLNDINRYLKKKSHSGDKSTISLKQKIKHTQEKLVDSFF